ncbi:MAG: UDP-N-acetylmuramoyl-L-alanine--D-glutamate ligase [Pseudomonadota bacterium]
MTRRDFYVIFGLGKTGLSCINYCLKRDIPFSVIDTREQPPQLNALNALVKDAKTTFGQLSEQVIEHATTLIVSPGVSLSHPIVVAAREKNIPVIGDIELFTREVKQPIVAITGSNGKSTVVNLLGEMAKQAGKTMPVAGNIGVPVLDIINTACDGYILELSSFQLQSLSSIKTRVASILNICEDHMDRHADMDEYISAKKRIYHDCETAVVNRHDQRLYPDDKSTPVISFGLDKPKSDHFGVIKEKDQIYLVYGKEKIICADQIKIKGQLNRLNMLAALAVGYHYGFDLSSMCDVLTTFNGLPHRCQLVRELSGVYWYNDSKATNVGATLAALQSLSENLQGKIVLIVGGLAKGIDFLPLRLAVKHFVRKVILFGAAAKQIGRVLSGVVSIDYAADLTEAVQIADLASIRGDVVLLSPACASFDMFNNFAHRGSEFARIVNEL